MRPFGTSSSRLGTLVVFAVFLLAGVAQAQTITGSITGTVVDSSGAIVPGSKVTVTNEATGAERTLITTDIDFNRDGAPDVVFLNEGQESALLLGKPRPPVATAEPGSTDIASVQDTQAGLLPAPSASGGSVSKTILSIGGGVALLMIAYILAATVVYLHTRYWLPLVLPLMGAFTAEYVALMTWRVVFEQAERRRVVSSLLRGSVACAEVHARRAARFTKACNGDRHSS